MIDTNTSPDDRSSKRHGKVLVIALTQFKSLTLVWEGFWKDFSRLVPPLLTWVRSLDILVVLDWIELHSMEILQKLCSLGELALLFGVRVTSISINTKFLHSSSGCLSV